MIPLAPEDAFQRDLLDLKRRPRNGWFRAGVRLPESVAEHSFAVGLLAWRAARARGLDPGRALLMGLLHDFHEARLGDIPRPEKERLGESAVRAADESARREQWGTGDAEMLELLAEFEAGASPLARLVREADALDLRLQARRYLEEGYARAEAFLGEEG